MAGKKSWGDLNPTKLLHGDFLLYYAPQQSEYSALHNGRHGEEKNDFSINMKRRKFKEKALH